MKFSKKKIALKREFEVFLEFELTYEIRTSLFYHLLCIRITKLIILWREMQFRIENFFKKRS